MPGLQVVDVERADDLLPVDHIAGIDRSSMPRCRVGRGCRCVLGIRSTSVDGEGSRRADRGNRCDHEVAAIEAFFRVFRHDGVLCHCERRRSNNGTHIGSKVRATSNYGNALNSQGCMISAGTMSTRGEVCAFVTSVGSQSFSHSEDGAPNVCFWHKADIAIGSCRVC